MAEPVKTPETTKFDETKFLALINQHETTLLADAGKEGFNPYIQIQQKLAPLLARLNDGEKSDKLMADLLAVKLESAQVCRVIPVQEPDKPKPPGGLNLGSKK